MLVAQSCPALRDPMDWNPPGSSVHGVRQARLLEWVGDLLNPGITLQEDSLLSEPPGKPREIPITLKYL